MQFNETSDSTREQQPTLPTDCAVNPSDDSPAAETTGQDSQPLPELLDRDDLTQRLGNNVELLSTVVELFREDYPIQIAELHVALTDCDADRMYRAAHSLKGSSASLGGKRAASKALSLELRVREECFGNADALAVKDMVAALEDEVANLIGELDAFVHESETAPPDSLRGDGN